MGRAETRPPPGARRLRPGLARRAVLLALLLGLAVRLAHAPWRWSFNPDEATYVEGATEPDSARFEALWHEHTHPPGYWWLLRGLSRLGTERLLWIAPSFLAGLAAILALAALGRAAAGGTGCVLGAFVGAFSPGLVAQSVVVRPYTLHVLALALLLADLLCWWRDRRPARLVRLGAAALAALLLLYGTVVALSAVGALALTLAARRALGSRALRDAALALAPAAAAALWLWFTHLKPDVMVSHHLQDARQNWARDTLVRTPWGALSALAAAAAHGVGLALLLPVLLGAAVALVRPGRGRRRLALGLGLLMLAIAVVFSALGFLPLGSGRHALHLVPAWVLLGAVGLRRVRSLARARAPRRAGAGRLGARARLVLPALAVALALLPAGPASGVNEEVIERSALEEVERAIRASGRPWWITDTQTHHLWVARLTPGDRVERAHPAWGGRTLEGDGLAFAYPWWVWRFPPTCEPSDDPLERVLGWMEAQGRLQDGKVGLVTGGWIGDFAWRVASELGASGEAVTLRVGDERLCAVVVDVAALRAWRARTP